MGRSGKDSASGRKYAGNLTSDPASDSDRYLFYHQDKASADPSFPDMVRALSEKKSDKNNLSAFQTLIVSTATRVGMGNLVGVVAAISAGGAGAVFWMWITALIGSSTAFIEATLAQLYKEKDPLYGGYRGGPAYYIHRYWEEKQGRKRKKVLLSVLFAISGLICWCGISQVISNSVTASFKNALIFRRCILPSCW